MQTSVIFRGALASLLLAATLALPACSKKEETKNAEVTAENIAAEDAITEQHDDATVTLAVKPEGVVKARIKSPDGEPLEKGVTGKLIVKPMTKGAEPVTADLTYDAKAGLYTAEIPELDADLTEVAYELDVKGKPVKGALHLPKGGTKELVATAKVTAEVKLPEGKKGPNGGIIQVAGDDVIEIVADEKTGDTRVYVLDDDFKPIPVGKRKVKLGIYAAGPEMIELSPEPKGTFFTGKLKVKTNPSKVTVVLYPEVEPEPVVVLCGWSPGTVVVVGAHAHVYPLFVAVNWAPVVVVGAPPVVIIDDHHHHHHGKGKGKWGWKGGHVNIHIH